MAHTAVREKTVLVATEQPITSNVETADAVLVVEAKVDRLLERAKKTQPDVILVDVALPGLSGAELITALRVVRPAAELILTRSINQSLEQVLAPRRRRRSKRSAVAALAAVLDQMGLTSAELRDVAEAIGNSSTDPD